MTRTLVLLVASALAFGQAHKQFEVASVRPVADDARVRAAAAAVHVDSAQVRMTYLSLKDYIGLAYQIRGDQIVGPDWMATERFDIAAKLPDGATQADVPEMLQSLLADRFQMKIHTEMKNSPVYALEVAKTGFTLTPTGHQPPDNLTPVNVEAGGSRAGVMITFGQGSFFALGPTGFEVKDLTMPRVADMLTRFLDRPVVDMTGLPGTYDFMLALTPQDRTAMLVRAAMTAGIMLPPQALMLLDSGSDASLVDALGKIGLTLRARKAPLTVVVVDEAQKTPTEN
jgi:uncharacterized protein (TIGR03435 family)